MSHVFSLLDLSLVHKFLCKRASFGRRSGFNSRHSASQMRVRERGFTLIEVMVAVAVFAVAGAAVMKATFENLRSVTSLEEITFATYVANNQLTQASLQARVKWPLQKTRAGETSMAGRQWYWQRRVNKTADDGLFEVIVIVASDEQLNNEVTRVTTFMTKPTR